MKTSDQGISLLLDREGCIMKAYRDTRGIWTIGVGHTRAVTEGDRCTEEQAMEWLAEDVAWCEDAIRKYVKVELGQNEFDALVSFIFNVGPFAFEDSTMLRLLNDGASARTIAQQFDRWNIPPEIVPRRMGEKAQFLGTHFVARLP